MVYDANGGLRIQCLVGQLEHFLLRDLPVLIARGLYEQLVQLISLVRGVGLADLVLERRGVVFDP